MTPLHEIQSKNMIEPFIKVTPQKIHTSLVKPKNTQQKITYPPPYNRAEMFVTIATQTVWCENGCCWCYKRDSIDARCCGVCYACCPRKTVDEQCNCCPNNFSTYWNSGYVQTVSGYGGEQGELEEKNGICCWFCFPVKFGIFFPCCVGSLGNGCINYMRDTNVNYFF